MEGIARQLINDSLRCLVLKGAARRHHVPHGYGRFLSRAAVSIVHVHEHDYHVRFPGGRWQVARQGETLVVPEERSHEFDYPHTGTLSGLFLQYQILGGVGLLGCFQVPAVYGGALGRRMGELCDELCGLWRPEDLSTVRAVARQQSAAFALLEAILSAADPDRQAFARLGELRRVGPVLDHIHRHLNEPLRRDELAAVVGIGATRFHGLFKSVMGIAPMAYVRRQRLEHAEQLLVSSDRSVVEIAEACGFADGFHFSKAFKAYRGVSPRAYRRLWDAMVGEQSAPE